MRRFLLSLCLFFAMASILPAQETLSFVYFDNYPPYSWTEKEATKGLLIDMVDEVLVGKLKMKVRHEGYPWARAQKMVELGEADGFVTLLTDERLRYAQAGKEVFIESYYRAYANKANPRLDELRAAKSIKDLAPFSITFYLGSGWGKLNEGHFPVREWVPTMDSCLKKVAAGRSDIFIDAYPIVRQALKALGLEGDIIELPLDVDKLEFHLYVGNKSKFLPLLPEIDKAIRLSKRDGSFDRILGKYGLK